jgi:hypothetical protein
MSGKPALHHCFRPKKRLCFSSLPLTQRKKKNKEEERHRRNPKRGLPFFSVSFFDTSARRKGKKERTKGKREKAAEESTEQGNFE